MVLATLVLSAASCDFFKKDLQQDAVARAGDSYLLKEDIKNLVPEGTSKEDSLHIIKTYIDRWATQKLLTNAAEINLDQKQKEEFDKLVQQYKIDLYTKAYIEQLVKTRIDTVITKVEIQQYYEENKENFRNDAILAQLSYIQVPSEHQKIAQFKDKFFNPKKNDQAFWETHLVQLKSAALNDSVWVDGNQIAQKIGFINSENINDYLQVGKKYEHTDSVSVYFVKIKSVLGKNEISPLEYIAPTIRQIILNKRKMELIKQIEKEITEDAFKNKKYEIYK
ncbi:MAG: hypothetical protein WCY89_02035 [Flavobacteriaceae bacterium]